MTKLIQGSYLRPVDAAEVSGYNKDYVCRLAKSGAFVAMRVGRNWLIDAASFSSFVAHRNSLADKRFGPRV